MKNILLFLTVLYLAFSTTVGAASDDQVLAELLNDFLAGASVNDASAHERFWDDDLVYTSSAGLRFGKADILDGINSDGEPAAEEPAVVYSAEDVRIRLYGDTAVVAFRLLGTGQGDAGEVSEYFNTGTFVKRQNEWRAVAWQATVIPVPD